MYFFLVGCGHFSWRSISLYNTNGYLIYRHSNVWICRQHPMVLLFTWNFFVRTLRDKILSSVPAIITQPRCWEKRFEHRSVLGIIKCRKLVAIFRSVFRMANCSSALYVSPSLSWYRKLRSIALSAYRIRLCLNINGTRKQNTDFKAVQPMLHV